MKKLIKEIIEIQKRIDEKLQLINIIRVQNLKN